MCNSLRPLLTGYVIYYTQKHHMAFNIGLYTTLMDWIPGFIMIVEP